MSIEDCELVKHWREQDTNRIVIVTNNSFKIAPWADRLYAMDRCWWMEYVGEASKVFQGFFDSPINFPNVEMHKDIKAGNSGAGAILLAEKLGAKKILLLGVDCKYIKNKRHWHGDHIKPLANANNVNKWELQFNNVRDKLKPETTVLNCSRDTDLKTFNKSKLEAQLCHI